MRSCLGVGIIALTTGVLAGPGSPASGAGQSSQGFRIEQPNRYISDVGTSEDMQSVVQKASLRLLCHLGPV